MKSKFQPTASSYKDPDGFIFTYQDNIFRQINSSYQKEYGHLMSSGLYQTLVDRHLLIPHQEVNHPTVKSAYKIIQPLAIPFISYPYEWCFSQLKAAALLTLKIQKQSLALGMSLKDASAYNIQFVGTKPIFIDTLSFESYQQDSPWIAYRQFTEHFLAPLMLMAKVDLSLNSLLIPHLNGIPIKLASTLLPKSSLFNFATLTHIHLNAKSQTLMSSKANAHRHRLAKSAQLNLLTNLETIITNLRLKSTQSTWSEYYSDTNYSSTAFTHKQDLIKKYLQKSKPKKVIDLGANTGFFSQLTAKTAYTLSVDIDPLAIEKNFHQFTGSSSLLPLIIDLTNPSPPIGWANSERDSFLTRTQNQLDAVLALALVHHLAIATNIPLDTIAKLFQSFGSHLIIEFIPKQDSQVQRLLKNREDIFPDYNQQHFELLFSKYYQITDSQPIKDSRRRLYLMKRR